MEEGVLFIVCRRLSEPQCHLKIRRHGDLKGVLVLDSLSSAALVELLAAILRITTQERKRGAKGNTRVPGIRKKQSLRCA